MNSRLILHCLFVWLALWPGPRPVFHAHCQYEGLAGYEHQLASHLALQHSVSDRAVADPWFPHCHWMACSASWDDGLVPGSPDASLACLSQPVDGVEREHRTGGDPRWLHSGRVGWAPESRLPVLPAAAFSRRTIAQIPSGPSYQQFFCVWNC